MKIIIILLGLFAIGYGVAYWAARPALRRYIGTPFVVSFVLLTVAGPNSPNSAVFLAICVIVMVATTRDPLDALCRYVLLIALVPGVTLHAYLGSTFIAQVNTPMALGVGCVLAMLVRSGGGRGKPVRGITAEDGLVVLFFLTLGIGSTRFASGTELLRQIITEGLGTLLPYYIFRRHVRSTDDLRIVIGCVAVASILLSIYAIYESRMGWTVFGSINAHLAEHSYISRNRMTRGDSLRASVTMSGPLMLACWLSLGGVAAACSRRLLRDRNAWLGCIGIISIGLISAQSRGNTAIFVLAILLILWMYGRTALAFGMAVAFAAVGSVLFLVARSSTFLSGFLNLDSAQRGDDVYDYRQLLLQRGMEEAAKHRWTGASMDAVVTALTDITQGQHIIDFVNTYLVIYLVSGLAGLVPVVVLLLLSIRKLARKPRARTDIDVREMRIFALVGFLSLLVELSFMSFIDRIPFLFGLVIASARLISARGTRPPALARPAPSLAKTPLRRRLEPG